MVGIVDDASRFATANHDRRDGPGHLGGGDHGRMSNLLDHARTR